MATRVPISKKLVIVNSASSVLTRVLNLTLLLWAIQYLVKRIPDDEYQLLPIVMGVIFLVPILTSFLTSGLGRFVTEAYAQGDEARVTEITSTMLPITCLAALVLTAVGAMCVYWIDLIVIIAPAQVADARLMLALLLSVITLRLAVAPLGVGLYVRQKFILKNATQLAGAVLRVALLLALLLRVGPEVKWVVVSLVISDLLVLLAQTLLSMRFLPALRFRRSAMRPGVAGGLISFGAWYLVGQLAVAIRQAADPILLNRLALPVDVTNFHLAATADFQIRQMRMTATAPLQPAMTAMYAQGKLAGLASVYLRGGRLSLWVLLAAAVPLMVFRVELLQAYLGPAFEQHRDAATALFWLLAAFPFIAPRGLLGNVLHAVNRLRPYAVCQLLVQLANLALTIVLLTVWQMGAVGSALASFIALAVSDPFIMWPMGIRTLHLKWSRFFREVLIPGYTPAVIAVIVGELIRRSLSSPSLTELALAIAACLLVFFAVVAFCLQEQDRRDLGAILRRFRRAAA